MQTATHTAISRTYKMCKMTIVNDIVESEIHIESGDFDSNFKENSCAFYSYRVIQLPQLWWITGAHI